VSDERHAFVGRQRRASLAQDRFQRVVRRDILECPTGIDVGDEPGRSRRQRHALNGAEAVEIVGRHLGEAGLAPQRHEADRPIGRSAS